MPSLCICLKIRKSRIDVSLRLASQSCIGKLEMQARRLFSCRSCGLLGRHGIVEEKIMIKSMPFFLWPWNKCDQSIGLVLLQHNGKRALQKYLQCVNALVRGRLGSGGWGRPVLQAVSKSACDGHGR